MLQNTGLSIAIARGTDASETSQSQLLKQFYQQMWRLSVWQVSHSWTVFEKVVEAAEFNLTMKTRNH